MTTLMLRKPAFGRRRPDLKARKVLIVGLGRSGLAAARLCLERGAEVLLADTRSEEALAASVAPLVNEGAKLCAERNDIALLDGVELVVLSPGVPRTTDLIEAALDAHLPVWGEIELASRYCDGRVIGITGSNGKSTVTSMIGAICRAQGWPGGTGGNLFTPFTDLLEHDEEHAVHSVELSSFQLESIQTLDCAVSVVLNVTPDHLDRYESFDHYARAKARLFELQRSGGPAVLNGDDPRCREWAASIGARARIFSLNETPSVHGFVRDGRLFIRDGEKQIDLLAASDLQLPGDHNIANALAAALATHALGCSRNVIAEALQAFRPLEHRLEPIATVNGVQFVNDSKATNPDSMERAIDAFERGRVHLILGGRDKGLEWEPLIESIAGRVKRLLLIGESAPRLAQQIGGRVPFEECGTMQVAVQRGHETADAGDVVLLSPACASFDQYKSFEARGDDFKSLVGQLEQDSDLGRLSEDDGGQNA